MSLLQKYNSLSTWGKFGAIGSVASIIGIPLSIYLPSIPLTQVQQTFGDNATKISNVQGTVTVNSLVVQRPRVDPQLAAQGMRVAAQSLRGIARFRTRSLPTKEWVDAEAQFKEGEAHYNRRDYAAAYENFKKAEISFDDLRSKSIEQGH